VLHNLAEDIDRVNKWLLSQQMTLNDSKTELLLIGSPENLNKIGRIVLKVNNEEITSVDSIRVLGCIIDSNLIWDKRINRITKASYAQLQSLYQIRPFVTKENMVTLIKTLIFSHFNYMAVIWGKATKKAQAPLRRVIKQCGRLALAKRKYDPISTNIRENLKWLFPEMVYKKAVFSHTFRILRCTESPEIWKNQFVVNSQIHEHRTRQETQLHHPYLPRTSAGEKTFQYTAYSLWTRLTSEEISCSYNSFMQYINNMLLNEQLLQI
jgi:hypothetical protein